MNPLQPSESHNPLCAGQLVNVMEHSGDPCQLVKPEMSGKHVVYIRHLCSGGHQSRVNPSHEVDR